MTSQELVTACQEYMAEKREQEAEPAEPEWTGHLHITPNIVAEILDSNKEE